MYITNINNLKQKDKKNLAKGCENGEKSKLKFKMLSVDVFTVIFNTGQKFLHLLGTSSIPFQDPRHPKFLFCHVGVYFNYLFFRWKIFPNFLL